MEKCYHRQRWLDQSEKENSKSNTKKDREQHARDKWRKRKRNTTWRVARINGNKINNWKRMKGCQVGWFEYFSFSLRFVLSSFLTPIRSTRHHWLADWSSITAYQYKKTPSFGAYHKFPFGRHRSEWETVHSSVFSTMAALAAAARRCEKRKRVSFLHSGHWTETMDDRYHLLVLFSITSQDCWYVDTLQQGKDATTDHQL